MSQFRVFLGPLYTADQDKLAPTIGSEAVQMITSKQDPVFK